jgi:hypothetical protein
MRCALCHVDVGPHETERCGRCGTRVHAECARELRGCPTLGCALEVPGAGSKGWSPKRWRRRVRALALGAAASLVLALGGHGRPVAELPPQLELPRPRLALPRPRPAPAAPMPDHACAPFDDAWHAWDGVEHRRGLVQAWQALGPGAAAATPHLVEALSTPDLRDDAVAALAAIGSGARAAVPALRVELRGPGCVTLAADALARIDPSSEPEAIAALGHAVSGRRAHPSVRATAAHVLGGLARDGHRAGAAAAALRGALDDPDAAVRASASGALAALGAPRQGPTATDEPVVVLPAPRGSGGEATPTADVAGPPR